MLTACNFTTRNTSTKDRSNIVSDSVSIEYHSDSSSVINSYQATVKCFSSSTRDAASKKKLPEYRMSLKRIENALYTRLDFSEDYFSDGNRRTIYQTNNERIMYNTTSGNIELRESINSNELESHLATISENVMLSRISIEKLLTHFKTLNYDITENAKEGTVIIAVPENSEHLQSRSVENDKYSYRRLFFDLQESVLTGTESCMINSEGTTITTTTEYIYDFEKENPVLIGEIIQTHYDLPEPQLDTSTDIQEQPGSLDEVEEVTQEYLDDLVTNGGIVVDSEIQLGDPTTLDYTEEIVTVFDDIKINSVSNDLFRIPSVR